MALRGTAVFLGHVHCSLQGQDAHNLLSTGSGKKRAQISSKGGKCKSRSIWMKLYKCSLCHFLQLSFRFEIQAQPPLPSQSPSPLATELPFLARGCAHKANTCGQKKARTQEALCSPTGEAQAKAPRLAERTPILSSTFKPPPRSCWWNLV